MKYVPDPHQVVAYDHLISNPRAALFLGMSLSKTVVTLTYLSDMIYREAAMCKVLVVAPDKVARVTWPDELMKWDHLSHVRYSVISGPEDKRIKALNADAEVFIIGVDNLSWLINRYITKRESRKTGREYGEWRGKLPFDGIVLDELSLFKGRDSNRFKKLRRALDMSEVDYRVGLTGTPAPNGFIDLWAEMVVIDGGDRLGHTFGEYVDKYFKTRGNGMIVYEYIAKPGAMATISKKISDIALSMQTRDHMVLPDLIMKDEVLTFDGFDKDTYDTLEREYVLETLEGSEVTVKTAADLSNKLLQVTSGAIYTEGKNWEVLNTLKLDRLKSLLDENPRENFILVYQFRHELDRIHEAIPYAREFRKGKGLIEDVRAWNDGEIRLLCVHPKGSGHGLNLQFGGSRMIFFSLTWNLEHYDQVIARLLRRGALKAITIYRFIVKGTRDESVKKRLQGKQSNQDFLLNEIKELRRKYGRE